jgi:hypothetical protein
MCGREVAVKLGFPQDAGTHAVEISEYFHEHPNAAGSFFQERIVPWLKQLAAASSIWRFPRKK